ncbi:type I restriction-modification system subunit M [Rhodococcoides fascians]|uniref:site-specific DNA-methyltransferase (adenine-specific) n=1 Tax=Rhodococcoides fascians TaxID=1828 RepID=A0A143QU30_RHOFA|nr:class I SAM-dependent DNA methyltransferase [Rhodococcus fascians]AMY26087.1 putative type I restriction enzymeP M protein [Rhodococcus fascians]OZC40951.1 SAM-dependent DNA methyltransferase [Rhodococcus fascians]
MKTTDLAKVRATLWAAADELRANSKLTPGQYRDPVLGLVFLAYAENRFEVVRGEVEAKASARNPATIADYKARSVLYVPDESRLSSLVDLPEGEDVGKVTDEAVKAIEAANPELKDILPRGYQKLERSTLIELLRLFAPLPTQLEGDAFGFIYEDFLSNFAVQEGKGGGEYFTPYSIVRLIVEILQPFQGRVFDPACGSGGMFVQCAKFVERHHDSASRRLSVFGAEKTEDTVPLAKMNLALHGLSGDIRRANSYYEDPHSAVGAFDYVMANPPFNVDKIKKEQLAGDKRFPFGLPKADNGNFLWIQQFYAALSPKGRAGFVMANSAGDAGHSEKEIRKQLVESGTVDVMVAISSNFFYTVTLPVTLWFLDKAKVGSPREDTVLFLDARHTFRQIDRAHRDFAPEQIEFLANIVRLYRGEDIEISAGSDVLVNESFPDGKYVDVGGLCKVATRAEIEVQGWSLNPGRYIGTTAIDESDVDFIGDLGVLYEEFTMLSDEADVLRSKVDAAIQGILER